MGKCHGGLGGFGGDNLVEAREHRMIACATYDDEVATYSSESDLLRQSGPWIPASAGMTVRGAGMTARFRHQIKSRST